MPNEILGSSENKQDKTNMTVNSADTKVPDDQSVTTALSVNTADLNAESLDLINKIIAEPDVQKTKDLTYLFNLNQNKKTIVRVNKLNDLLDVVTDQALTRFTKKPDEISNSELIQVLKTTQELIERGQTQVSGVTEQPLIQINQQNNEVNLNGDSVTTLNRDSREKIKNAVMKLLSGMSNSTQDTSTSTTCAEIIDTKVEEIQEND